MIFSQRLSATTGFIIVGLFISPLAVGQDTTAAVAPSNPYTLSFEDLVESTIELESEPVDSAQVIASSIDVHQAIDRYEQLNRSRPDHWPTKLILGKLLLRKAKTEDHLPSYSRAKEQLTTAVRLAPDSAAGKLALGQCHLAMHEFQQAWETSKRLTANSSEQADWPSAIALRFDAALELGQMSDAQSTLKQLLGLEDSPPIQARAARLAELRGEHDAAIELLRKAVKELAQSTDDAEGIAWYKWRLGTLLFDVGRTTEAEQAFRAALKLSPDDDNARVGLARVYFATEQFDQSEKILSAAAQSEAPPVLALLGDLLANQGRTQEAEELWQRARTAMKAEAEFAEVAHSREVAMFLADHRRELELATQLAELNLQQRQDAGAWDCVAWVAFRRQDLATAREAISKALDAASSDASILFHSAMIAAASKDHQIASEQVRTICDLNPKFSITYAGEFADLRSSLQSIH